MKSVPLVVKLDKQCWTHEPEFDRYVMYHVWEGKGGAVVRALVSHQCGPGSNPVVVAICGLSLFVVSSLLCSERFFSRYFGFPLSSKKKPLPNSNSIWNARTRLNEFI